MNNLYRFGERDDLTYEELRKTVDQLYLEHQFRAIENAKISFLESLRGIPCSSFIKKEYVEFGAKYACEGILKALSEFVPETRGYEGLPKLFIDFASLMNDVTKNAKKLAEVVVFFIPKEQKYIYFTDKNNCSDFVKNYKGEYLVEIIAGDMQQNFSFNVIAGTKDDAVCKIQKELETGLKKINEGAQVWLSIHSDVVWVHVVGMYFKNFLDAVSTVGTILEKYKKDISYPELKLDQTLFKLAWEKIIPNTKLTVDVGEKIRSGPMTTEEKIKIINNYTFVVNNGNNAVVQTGNNNVAVNGNNNAVTNNPVSTWIDQNPPLEDEGSDTYRNRLLQACKGKISSKQLAELLRNKGYKRNKKDKCYWVKQ